MAIEPVSPAFTSHRRGRSAGNSVWSRAIFAKGARVLFEAGLWAAGSALYHGQSW